MLPLTSISRTTHNELVFQRWNTTSNSGIKVRLIVQLDLQVAHTLPSAHDSCSACLPSPLPTQGLPQLTMPPPPLFFLFLPWMPEDLALLDQSIFHHSRAPKLTQAPRYPFASDLPSPASPLRRASLALSTSAPHSRISKPTPALAIAPLAGRADPALHLPDPHDRRVPTAGALSGVHPPLAEASVAPYARGPRAAVRAAA